MQRARAHEFAKWIPDLIRKVEIYNSTYSAGAVMGRSVATALFGFLDGNQGFNLEDPKGGVNGQVTLQAILDEYSNGLESLGLKIISPAEYATIDGNRPSSDRLMIAVNNEEKFKKFLNQCDRSTVERNPEAKDLILLVASDAQVLLGSPISSGEHRATVDNIRAIPEALRNLDYEAIASSLER